MMGTVKLLHTSCPNCHHAHEVSAESIGYKITCVECGRIFNAVKFDPLVLIRSFSKIAIQNQLMTEEKLERALNGYEGDEASFATRLVEQGVISDQDKSRLLIAAVRKLNKKFTNIAVMHAYISDESAEKALLIQAEDFKAGRLTLIGDLLIKENLLSYDQVEAIYQMFKKKDGPPVQVKGDEIYDKSGRFPLIGLIAVDKNIISRNQLEAGLQEQKALAQKGENRHLEDILLEQGSLSEETLLNLLILTIRKLSKKFAEIVVKKGFAEKSAVEKALFRQSEELKKKVIRPFCGILEEEGVLSVAERDQVFEEFQGLQKDKIERLARKAISLLDVLEPLISAPVLSLEGTPLPRQEPPFFETSAPEESIVVEAPAQEAQKMEGDRDKLICDLAVYHKLIAVEDLKKAVDEERSDSGKPTRSIETLLVEKKLVSQSDINRLLAEHAFLKARDQDLIVGKEAVKKGLATKEALKNAFVRQSKIFGKEGRIVSIGDILVETNIMSTQNWESLSRPHGEADKLAPIPDADDAQEEVYLDQPEISVSISEDALSAYVSIARDVNRDIEGSLDEWIRDIKNKISEKGIYYGIISDSLIEGCLKSSVLKKKSFKVASGDAPQQGKEGKIIYHFETDYRKAGVMSEDGIIDFRDRGDVPFVKAGALIAELSRTVQGKAGYDIFGKLIPAQELPEFELKCGPGVELAENGLKAFAAIDGMPNLSLKNEISVLSEFVIKGNVDYETGHIDFSGNVVVQGAVCQGFRVRSVNLTAREIVGGEIDITGDLNVSAGIIDAEIKAEGSIRAMYMYNSNVEAFGDLMIEKEIMDSRAILSGVCKSERCKIIFARISARKGFDVAQIGTSVSEPCRLRAGVNDHVDLMIGNVKKIIKEKLESLEAIQHESEKYEKLNQENDLLISENSARQDNLAHARIKAVKESLALKEKGEVEAAGILESNISKVDQVASSLSEKIRECVEKKEKFTHILLENREKAEKIVGEIENLNDEIRVITSKIDQSDPNPTVKVSGLITSKTIIMGVKSSIILPDDMKGVSITEIKITDPEAKGPPRWEMSIRKLR